MNRDEHHSLEAALSPELLELHDSDVMANDPIRVKGSAQCTEGALVVSLDITTAVQMRCSICNEWTRVDVHAPCATLVVEISSFPCPPQDITPLLREEVILLIPQFVECHAGNCPGRKGMTPYLRSAQTHPSHHFPFAEL